jgi:exo-beta-1,3-glucanase (GH17 family)
MDFGVLTQNLNTGVYTNNSDFVRDTNLMFVNGKSYWDRGTAEHEAALELYKIFRNLVHDMMPQEVAQLKYR